MRDAKKLLSDYKITPRDIENIKSLASFMSAKTEELADYHYSKIFENKAAALFVRNEEVLERARKAFVDWFAELLAGNYSPVYFMKLNRIGKVHVKIGLPCEYVNIHMSLIRDFVVEQVLKEFENSPGKAAPLISSLNKALDMNLDIMTRSYRAAEMHQHFLSSRIDNWIISSTKRLVTGFNIILMVGLLVIGIATVFLAVNGLAHLLTGELERGVLTALGSVLVLWVIIELLDTQIRHMRGQMFAIKVFISVALVAELRRVLITSIEHASWQEEGMLALSVLILGAVFWMISVADRQS